MCTMISELDEHVCAQTKEGTTPNGLNGMEYQDFSQFCKLPECDAAAAKHFQLGANDWFTPEVAKKQQEIEKWLCWNTKRDGPFWMMLEDHDGRHTYNDIYTFLQTKTMQDRTELAKGHPRAIHFNKTMRLVPSAKRVPDCLQQPIECTFSVVKPKLTEAVADIGKATTLQIAEIVLDMVPQAVTQKLVHACWRNAASAIQVFAGTEDEHVMVQNKKGGARTYKVLCTHGNWVPKLVAG
jgi:hypothetical protein